MSETNEIRKAIMERLGSVAKMARFIDVASWAGDHGATYEATIIDDNGRFQPGVVLRSKDSSETLLTRSAPEFKTEAGARKWLQGKIAEMKSRVRASRPGAKAKFADDAKEVAQEILRQLGGGRFMAMVGGKNAMHGNFGGKPGLQVSIGRGAKDGINRLIVTLDRGSDTYDMEFWRIGNRGLSTKKVAEASGVYADSLQRVFTSKTDFHTSMSRPGAKAKFEMSANEKASLAAHFRAVTILLNKAREALFAAEKSGDNAALRKAREEIQHYSKQREYAIAMLKSAELMSRPGAKAKFSAQFETGKVYQHNFAGDSDARVQWKVLARTASTMTIKKVGAGHKDSVTGLTQGEEKRVKINSDAQGEFVYPMGRYSMAPILRATRSSFSRPGAKVKMGMTNAGYKTLVDAIRKYGAAASAETVEQAKQMKQEPTEFTDADVQAVISKMKSCRPGAKAKSTHAADEAVSKKIALLMDEGYPQDQAVAIALDMKRKGNI